VSLKKNGRLISKNTLKPSLTLFGVGEESSLMTASKQYMLMASEVKKLNDDINMNQDMMGRLRFFPAAIENTPEKGNCSKEITHI